GEHAVVHGQPAISIPFPIVGVESIVCHKPGPIEFVSDLYKGPANEAPHFLHGMVYCMEAIFVYSKLTRRDFNIELRSTIHQGKGLGSSAAVAIALVRSIYASAGKSYTKEELLKLANVSETFAHGAPSGIDALTIASDLPLWF